MLTDLSLLFIFFICFISAPPRLPLLPVFIINLTIILRPLALFSGDILRALGCNVTNAKVLEVGGTAALGKHTPATCACAYACACACHY